MWSRLVGREELPYPYPLIGAEVGPVLDQEIAAPLDQLSPFLALLAFGFPDPHAIHHLAAVLGHPWKRS